MDDLDTLNDLPAVRRTTAAVEPEAGGVYTVTVSLFAVHPWPEISAPVDCRVIVEYTDVDHWQATHVEFPELVTRDGPFRPHPRWVRLDPLHPLSEAVKTYCETEDGAKVVREAVQDHIGFAESVEADAQVGEDGLW